MRGLSTWVIAVWALAFALLLLNAAVSIYNIDVLITTDRAVSHSREVSRAMVDLLSAIKDAETGQRGFIISDRKDYLRPFYEGEEFIPKHLERLAELTAGDDYYRSRIDNLGRLIRERTAELRRIIEIHRVAGDDPSRDAIREGKGQQLMDQIRAEIGEMEQHEQQILAERSRVRQERYQSSTFSALLGGILTVLMVAMAFILVRVEFARRQQAEIAARQAALQLADEEKRQSEVLAKMVKSRTAELQSANDLLHDEIGERTRAEARAQSAAVELTRSNEELEKFAYVASHDLQEPLRKIQAFGDRLVKRYRDTLGPDGAEYLERMQAAATRMRTLINDLLNYSRVTTNAQPFSPVDLNVIAREVIDDLSEQVAQTNARVHVGELPQIHADPLQMRQLFQNLIGNALKFHKADTPPVVTIRSIAWDQLPENAGPPAPAGTGYRIAVSDNGIGFEQSFADRIFELFQRLHGRGEYEGTGIGLAICRKIVQRHGGTISAHGRQGEGATFLIDLPKSSGL